MGIAHIKSLVTTATTGAHYLGEHQCRIIGYSKKCCHVANKTVWYLWLNKNLIIMKKNDDIQDLYLQCKNVVFDKGCQWSDSGPIIKKMVTVKLHCNHLHVASWYNPLEFYETLRGPHKATRELVPITSKMERRSRRRNIILLLQHHLQQPHIWCVRPYYW